MIRGVCSSAALALVLAAAFVLTSCSYVADGARTRTTPNASLGSSDADRLGGFFIAVRGGTNNAYKKPNQATTLLHGSEPAATEDSAESLRAASGSRLPDCGHACGACSPCRRVMVSFMCAESASEACPVAYRCMCRGRFFRVPSF